MKLPLSWLSDYLDMSGIDDKMYEHGMTMSGSKVEGIENLGGEINNVVTGKILKIDRHPDADKLVVCQLDIGESEPIQIVTGATNVFEGAVVPAAKHRSTLAHGLKITKGKLRGVTSMGMMCSSDELGLTEGEADGILILPEDTQIGKDICEVLELNESVAEFEITSNRPDCLSVIGIARETAATFERKFSIPPVKVKGAGGNLLDYASVEVLDKDLCPRYTAKVIKNIKIAPSPAWMQNRLKACGVRSINNIVDITNYIMLEYGQPMHAFDLSDVAGNKIVVRRAHDGEELTTLDDVERNLTADMLVIADGERAVGVAGVMGGQNSEIKDTTTDILFESANFNAISVRRTAKALGLRTEASSRFEKGLDAENTLPAIERACQLIEELGAGEVADGLIDIRGEVRKPVTLPLEVDKINNFLGHNISCEEMVKILERLEFKTDGKTVTAPSFRGDIECMADIAEEIVRIYGYDKIPSTVMDGAMTQGGKNSKQKLEDKIKDILVGQGLYEITTYSFVSPNLDDMLCVSGTEFQREAVKILNPLGADVSVMRTFLLGSMLEILKQNYNHRNPQARLFELGNAYIPKPDGELPEQVPYLSVGMYGKCDYYDLKGVIEELLSNLGITKYSVVPMTNHPTFHPGRTAQIMVNDIGIGAIGQVHPKVAKNFELECEVYFAEFNLNKVFDLCKSDKKYKSIPKFPSIVRDIAVIVTDDVNAADIEKIFSDNKGNIMEEFKLFDVYKGKQIDEDKKSVAYSLTFRSGERTLTDDEVNAVMEKIIADLQKRLNAQLR